MKLNDKLLGFDRIPPGLDKFRYISPSYMSEMTCSFCGLLVSVAHAVLNLRIFKQRLDLRCNWYVEKKAGTVQGTDFDGSTTDCTLCNVFVLYVFLFANVYFTGFAVEVELHNLGVVFKDLTEQIF